jgi:butyryl-CoA dehydrogenase
LRDARILPIYEGTTGIQANDFVGRKILGDEGRAMRALMQDMRTTADQLGQSAQLEILRLPMVTAIDDLSSAVDWLIDNAPVDRNVPGAAAVNLLLLAGTVLGGWQMARAALAVADSDAEVDAGFREAKLLTTRFYIESILPRASYYKHAAMAGPDTVMAMPEDLF